MFDALFGWLGSLWQYLSDFFHHVIDYIKHTILPLIAKEVAALERFLNKYLGPIVRFLRKVRAWYLKYIYPIQHKILEVISRVRAVLAVFRILGFKWAAKLDADLQKLQAWVTASITDILRPLNLMQDYLNLILDPGMILRKDFFAASLFGSLSNLKNAVAFGNSAPLSAAQQDAQARDKGLLDPTQPIATWAADGTVTLTPGFADVVAKQQAAIPDYLRAPQ